jgi:hypothetical protein
VDSRPGASGFNPSPSWPLSDAGISGADVTTIGARSRHMAQRPRGACFSSKRCKRVRSLTYPSLQEAGIPAIWSFAFWAIKAATEDQDSGPSAGSSAATLTMRIGSMGKPQARQRGRGGSDSDSSGSGEPGGYRNSIKRMTFGAMPQTGQTPGPVDRFSSCRIRERRVTGVLSLLC